MLAAPVPVLTVIMTSQDQGTAGRDNPRACHAIERRPTQVIYRWNDVSRLIRLDFQTADSVRMPGWEQDSPPQVASRAARGVIVLHLLSAVWVCRKKPNRNICSQLGAASPPPRGLTEQSRVHAH